MGKINNSPIRNGNFTSSEIFNLLALAKDGKSWGDPALNYIEECNMERMIGRSVDADSFARPLMWGKVVEKRVFKLLPTEYSLSSSDTIRHPTIPYWVGSPEGNKFDEGKTVYDIKSPMTMKSFCKLVAPLYDGLTGMDAMNAVRKGFVDKKGLKRKKHSDGEKFYWQIVSGSILTESKFGELIVYAPYQSELESIKNIVDNWNDGNPNHVAWINWAEPDELPLLLDNGKVKNMNIIRFEIPEEDKNLLTSKVQEAGQFLQPFYDEAA